MYYRELWNRTKRFTVKMIEDSSKAMTELIRMAWIEAGKPIFSAHETDLILMQGLLNKQVQFKIRILV